MSKLLFKISKYKKVISVLAFLLSLSISNLIIQNYYTFGSTGSDIFYKHPVAGHDSNHVMTNKVEPLGLVRASGHFANNQIQGGVVTWIQGGFWNLDIYKDEVGGNQSDPSNLTANFDANFTMIKPDGSLSHQHLINNFRSDDVIFAGNDIVINGVADIHSSNKVEYRQVPITVHLMGKQVLGLMIDMNQTNKHFSSSNEIFGTLISGIGLNKSSN